MPFTDEDRKKLAPTTLNKNWMAMGMAFKTFGKHVYGGTVDPVTVEERRAKNKRARKARRINRRSK